MAPSNVASCSQNGTSPPAVVRFTAFTAPAFVVFTFVFRFIVYRPPFGRARSKQRPGVTRPETAVTPRSTKRPGVTRPAAGVTAPRSTNQCRVIAESMPTTSLVNQW